MHYEDADVLMPLRAEEIPKLPASLDAEQGIEATSTRIEPISNPQVLVPQAIPWSGGSSHSLMISAEEEGFEPTVPLRVRRFSKPVP